MLDIRVPEEASNFLGLAFYVEGVWQPLTASSGNIFRVNE